MIKTKIDAIKADLQQVLYLNLDESGVLKSGDRPNRFCAFIQRYLYILVCQVS